MLQLSFLSQTNASGFIFKTERRFAPILSTIPSDLLHTVYSSLSVASSLSKLYVPLQLLSVLEPFAVQSIVDFK